MSIRSSSFSIDAAPSIEAISAIRPVSCALDVGDARAEEHHRRVRDVGKMHPEVVDHVGPFPPARGRDRGGAVEEVLEDGVEAARRETFEPVPLASLPDVRVVVVPVDRRDACVVVQRHAHALSPQPIGARLVLRRQRHDRRLDTPELGHEVERGVVLALDQVGERPIAVVSLLRLHPGGER